MHCFCMVVESSQHSEYPYAPPAALCAHCGQFALSVGLHCAVPFRVGRFWLQTPLSSCDESSAPSESPLSLPPSVPLNRPQLSGVMRTMTIHFMAVSLVRSVERGVEV